MIFLNFIFSPTTLIFVILVAAFTVCFYKLNPLRAIYDEEFDDLITQEDIKDAFRQEKLKKLKLIKREIMNNEDLKSEKYFILFCDEFIQLLENNLYLENDPIYNYELTLSYFEHLVQSKKIDI